MIAARRLHPAGCQGNDVSKSISLFSDIFKCHLKIYRLKSPTSFRNYEELPKEDFEKPSKTARSIDQISITFLHYSNEFYMLQDSLSILVIQFDYELIDRNTPQ